MIITQAKGQLFCEKIDKEHNYQKKSKIPYSHYKLIQNWCFSQFGPSLYLYSFVYEDKVFFYTEEEGIINFLDAEDKKEAVKMVEEKIKEDFEAFAATCYVEEDE